MRNQRTVDKSRGKVTVLPTAKEGRATPKATRNGNEKRGPAARADRAITSCDTTEYSTKKTETRTGVEVEQ